MTIMDSYATDTPHGKSLLKIVLSLIRFVSPDQISKIKICHMVASEHTEVIEGRRQLIATMLSTLKRQLSMFPLMMLVILWMKRMRVV